MRGVQKRRPSLFDLVDKMKTISVPTLIMTGDEDWPCLEPGLLMKRTIPTAALVVMPNAGHTINLEDPAAFNQHHRRVFPYGRCRGLAQARPARNRVGDPWPVAGRSAVSGRRCSRRRPACRRRSSKLTSLRQDGAAWAISSGWPSRFSRCLGPATRRAVSISANRSTSR